MILVFVINTLIGCSIFALSASGASLFYVLLIPDSEALRVYFFIPILAFCAIFFYLSVVFFSIAACRIIIWQLPKKSGEFPNTSTGQMLRVTADVLTCHLCQPLFPSMPFLVTLLGARTGEGFIFTGKIFNADLLEVGNNVLVGEEAFLCGHLQEKNTMFLDKIRIGHNVTIGVRSFIMPGVTIGENSIIAAYSVVPKGTTIPPNEIWGGNPVKKIKSIEG